MVLIRTNVILRWQLSGPHRLRTGLTRLPRPQDRVLGSGGGL